MQYQLLLLLVILLVLLLKGVPAPQPLTAKYQQLTTLLYLLPKRLTESFYFHHLDDVNSPQFIPFIYVILTSYERHDQLIEYLCHQSSEKCGFAIGIFSIRYMSTLQKYNGNAQRLLLWAPIVPLSNGILRRFKINLLQYFLHHQTLKYWLWMAVVSSTHHNHIDPKILCLVHIKKLLLFLASSPGILQITQDYTICRLQEIRDLYFCPTYPKAVSFFTYNNE
jgi:hypothetical protein